MRGRGAAFLVGRAAGKNRAAQEAASQQAGSSSKSQTDELEKLSKMHDNGELSDKEYTEAKKKVLHMK